MRQQGKIALLTTTCCGRIKVSEDPRTIVVVTWESQKLMQNHLGVNIN